MDITQEEIRTLLRESYPVIGPQDAIVRVAFTTYASASLPKNYHSDALDSGTASRLTLH